MQTAQLLHNHNSVNLSHSFARKYGNPSQEDVRRTQMLHTASLDDAMKYGGEVTRAAIDGIGPGLVGNYKYTTVDTKVHMLMPGMSPSIPGWHTDGVPRDANNAPVGPDIPNAFRQVGLRSPTYHLMCLGGSDSLTEFIGHPLELDLPVDGDFGLYKIMHDQADALHKTRFAVDMGQIATFDWWAIHRGVTATKKGWRFLIRVTESDYLKPNTDLRDVIRTQIQVYTPDSIGW